MPESRKNALKRARKLGFKSSSVTSAGKGEYFIAPKGIEGKGAKKAYAKCRSDGGSQEKCAKISWFIEKKK